MDTWILLIYVMKMVSLQRFTRKSVELCSNGDCQPPFSGWLAFMRVQTHDGRCQRFLVKTSVSAKIKIDA